jgi:hypothetical protein
MLRVRIPSSHAFLCLVLVAIAVWGKLHGEASGFISVSV